MTPRSPARLPAGPRSGSCSGPCSGRTPGPRRRALPRRFRRPALLIVGCGDVGLRLVRQLAPRLREALRVVAVSRRPAQRETLRALGARPLTADLDRRGSLRRLAALGRWTIDLAPPPAGGDGDPRSAHLLAAAAPALRRRRRRGEPAARWVYLSTTGVYGDCAGQVVDETRRPAPASARAKRRAAAEREMREASSRGLARVAILRAPGIHAHDRLPLERLRRGAPVPVEAEDPFIGHIHAEDLARIAWLALFRGRAGRVYHAADDSALKMGAYLDRVADAAGLPRPPRMPRQALVRHLTPSMLSFLDESRRLANRRLKRELRYRLRWPGIDAALAAADPALL